MLFSTHLIKSICLELVILVTAAIICECQLNQRNSMTQLCNAIIYIFQWNGIHSTCQRDATEKLLHQQHKWITSVCDTESVAMSINSHNLYGLNKFLDNHSTMFLVFFCEGGGGGMCVQWLAPFLHILCTYQLIKILYN